MAAEKPKDINKTHFTTVYRKETIREPSTFAQFVVQKNVISPTDVVMEWGSGTGRDCALLAPKCAQFIATDLSATEKVRKFYGKHKNVRYDVTDFSLLPDQKTKINVIYSRFSLHSVDKEAATRALNWASKNLAKSGWILIEARSVKDELYGKGQQDKHDEDAWIASSGRDHGAHYRRFIRLEGLTRELTEKGFQVTYQTDERDLSPCGDDNPSLVRVFAQKV